MGADLYIEDEQGNEIKYFRDSYNDSNVFWKFEGSYWEMDVIARGESEEGYDYEKAVSYIEEKLKNEEIFEKNISEYSKEEQEYFTKEAKQLKEFIKTARAVLDGKMNGKIIFSM